MFTILSQCNKKSTSLRLEGLRRAAQGGSRLRALGMLYLAYQTQSDMMVPVRAWATMALAAGGPPTLGDNSAVRNLSAAYEMIARAGLTHTRPAFGINSVVVGNREVEVREAAAFATPFGTLLRFRKDVAVA